MNQVKEKIEKGLWVKYRNRQQIKSQKESSTNQFPDTWFLKGNTTSILKINATPNGILNSILRKKFPGKIGPEGGQTKFVELGGTLI